MNCKPRKRGMNGSGPVRHPLILLIAILSAGLMGCVSPRWKKLTLEQSNLMDKALPMMEACSNHLERDHPGHKLNLDGSLRIITR